jgi:hypothetical protein
MDVNSGDVPGRESPEDDAWGFLASRKVEDTTVGQENPAKPVIPVKRVSFVRAWAGSVSGAEPGPWRFRWL